MYEVVENMIDISVVNSFFLFQLHRAEYPEVEELRLPARYSAEDCQFTRICSSSSLLASCSGELLEFRMRDWTHPSVH